LDGVRRAPHALQNLAPTGLSASHTGQAGMVEP
jgi:hypothetical protein